MKCISLFVIANQLATNVVSASLRHILYYCLRARMLNMFFTLCLHWHKFEIIVPKVNKSNYLTSHAVSLSASRFHHAVAVK